MPSAANGTAAENCGSVASSISHSSGSASNGSTVVQTSAGDGEALSPVKSSHRLPGRPARHGANASAGNLALRVFDHGPISVSDVARTRKNTSTGHCGGSVTGAVNARSSNAVTAAGKSGSKSNCSVYEAAPATELHVS